jgi:hypothetical protein
VLRTEQGGIAEITTFGARLFPAFGLPPELTDAEASRVPAPETRRRARPPPDPVDRAAA